MSVANVPMCRICKNPVPACVCNTDGIMLLPPDPPSDDGPSASDREVYLLVQVYDGRSHVEVELEQRLLEPNAPSVRDALQKMATVVAEELDSRNAGRIASIVGKPVEVSIEDE